MAASMMRVCNTKLVFKVPFRRVSTNNPGYYVLIPEVPIDTPETNVLLQYQQYPQFSEITPDKVLTGCAKLAINYDMAITNHLENIEEPGMKKTFDSVFLPIEKASVPLSYAWRTANHLRNTCGGPYHQAFDMIHRQSVRCQNERWASVPLYEAVKDIRKQSKEDKLSDFQQRLVDMYLLESRLNGIELKSAKRGVRNSWLKSANTLMNECSRYRANVSYCHNLFNMVLPNSSSMKEMPTHILNTLSVNRDYPEAGPWKITLNEYKTMMRFCSDSMTRWSMWHAFNNRASQTFKHLYCHNTKITNVIIKQRTFMAKMLGYETFAHMSMETKMAGNIDTVINFIESMKTHFKPIAEEELNSIREFANCNGALGELQLWDIDYWTNKMRAETFGFNSAELSNYFPLPSVLDGLFKLCKSLFGLNIVDCTGEVDTWHDSVRFYKLYDESGGPEIAAFYIDPYARPGYKADHSSIESGRERSELHGTTPISYLNMNLPPPTEGKPALLSYEHISDLFYEFGNGLQQLVSTVPYSEISGQRNVEWDAIMVCGNVMRLLLNTPTWLRAVSGGTLPEEDVIALLDSRRALKAYSVMNTLYRSAFDMECYVSYENGWHDNNERLWAEFMPIERHNEDSHPTSFSQIFCAQHAAAYYSIIWSEMVAADIFCAFSMEGEDAAVVGRRFRQTFLSLGGGVAAKEIFRKFRGRDPSHEAIFNLYGHKALQ